MKFPVRKDRRAASIIEYAVLIIMFLAAILLMQKHIVRTFFGRWKDAGDTFSYGEQYDANTTIDCQRYAWHNSQGWHETWYSGKCYDCCIYSNSGSCPDWIAGFVPDTCRNFINDDQKQHCCKTACANQTVCNF
jgi:hypothetical protein